MEAFETKITTKKADANFDLLSVLPNKPFNSMEVGIIFSKDFYEP